MVNEVRRVFSASLFQKLYLKGAFVGFALLLLPSRVSRDMQVDQL